MPAHPRPLRRPWQQAFERWTARQHQAQPQHTLRQRNIYVVPSGAGWMLAITLLILLVASINFQLNLGYALTFLIAGSALASLWVGHRNMQGIHMRLGTLHPTFQGQRATIPILLDSTHGSHHRYSLSLAIHLTRSDTLAWVHTDIPSGHTSTITLGSVPQQRGWHPIPRVVIENRYPLGIFRLWSYWQPDGSVLVYPAPETPTPPIRMGDSEEQERTPQRTTGTAKYDDIRGYQRGDPLRSVVWKKAATALATGSGDLVVRHGYTPPTHTLWLDASATDFSDPEAQIARLTAWVLHAHEAQWQWGLKLPSGNQIQPSTGAQHLHACLMALAIDGHGSVPSKKP